MEVEWTCPNCQTENADSAKFCSCCEDPKPVQSPAKKKAKKEEEDEEAEEEEYEGSSGEGEDFDEDDDMQAGNSDDDPDLDTFDQSVGNALAQAGKGKIMEHVRAIQKAHGEKSVSLLSQDPNYIVRTKLSVSFLDPITAKIWGINHSKPIIIELKFVGPLYLEDKKNPPLFNLYQSGDVNLGKEKLDDVSSFGLDWQLRARLNDWLNEPGNWPPKDLHFIQKVMDHMIYTIKNCTKNCIICNDPLPFQMIKPAVCDNTLCVHSHEQYGLGADVASEIRDSPDVVDLLISFTIAASQGEERRFNPYPVGVEVKYLDDQKRELTAHLMNEKDVTKRNLASVNKVVSAMPAVEELTQLADTKSIKTFLDTKDKLAFPLLRWIITSNRAHLAKCEPADKIEEMKTEHQYVFLSSPPEKEAKFQRLKKEKGSFWAFHGSQFSNWHSILRIGLKNYSNTALMSTGAAYGAGIYLAGTSQVSFGYARAQPGWNKSRFSKKGYSSLQCLALCEVINAGYTAKPYYVIPEEDHVMTRYFFIFENSGGQPQVEANKLKNLKSGIVDFGKREKK
eukprot:TRINITY_DN6231_c0_g1_i1.p1 TRINITY_DN6231_c0_g1~~TRINITY_DN6231_c0_g1_i1.p1  ORF type:complete len:564 (-),score=140.41 TRINITY_DN6231_c0_g1_i1:26-1717(-)